MSSTATPAPPRPPPHERFADVFGDTPRARKRIRRLRRIDRVVASFITLGGIAIILAVFGIFFFVFAEALPLFWPVDSEQEQSVAGVSGAGRPLAVGEDDYRSVGWALSSAGFVRLLDFGGRSILADVPLEGLGEATVTSGARAGTTDVLAAGTSDGRVLAAGIGSRPVYENGVRVRQEIEVEWQAEIPMREDGGPVALVAVTGDGERFTIAGAAPGWLGVASHRVGGTRPRVGEASAALENATVTALTLDETAENLVAGTSNGEILRFELDREAADLTERRDAGGAPVTALAWAFGSQTLLVGQADGTVTGWQGIRAEDGGSSRALNRVREYQALGAPVTALAPSRRNKTFLAVDRQGDVRLLHVTTERSLTEVEPLREPTAVALAPRVDGFDVAGADGELARFTLAAPHPEVTLRSLFLPMLYEGYDDPQFVWQSTGGTDDFEPKFSLVPLILGSLKGVLYAMLISVPLAILAALYTSQFAHLRLRSIVKPTVELMGALPSVVIGFLAGLWLSPVVAENLAGTFLLLLMVPVAVAVAAFVLARLPREWRKKVNFGWELHYLLPFLLAGGAGALLAATPLEDALFGGDLRHYLLENFGVHYDPRNAFVVGIALGFAVVPIIFTVAEDAMSNVPRGLRAASEALGASRWQTAWRLVMPAASPGIFAAVMLGFGRAVGETMIVVMATGNTPILDFSPFNGMRTISACIAVEMPEAPVDSSLYRVLFLAGGLLFVFTFLLNTAAETVGQGLRKRYARW